MKRVITGIWHELSEMKNLKACFCLAANGDKPIERTNFIMLIAVFSISAGIFLLYAGAEFLVRGSSAIALRLRVSHFLLSILRRRFYPLFANFLRFLLAETVRME